MLLAVSATAQSPSEPNARWGNWRGPFSNGTASPTAKPPLKWSAQDNIRWQTPLPGEGASTPIVWGDQVFVTAAIPTGQAADPVTQDPRNRTMPPNELFDLALICIDRGSGKILWKTVAATVAPHEGRHPTNTYAGGSPATDGKRIVLSFGSHGAFGFTMDGKLLWQRDLGRMRTRRGWGEAITPVLFKDRVIINCDQEDDSYLFCLDAATGATVWRKDRPEEVTSWNTPLCTTSGKGDVVVVNGTGAARAYELATGAERWRCSGQTINAIPSPLQIGDGVVCMSGYRGQAARCIPLDAEGDVTNTDVVRWRYDRDTPYVPSPTLYQRRLYFTKVNEPILTVLDAATGEVRQPAQRLAQLGRIYASPLAADGRLYIADRDGATAVLDAATLEVLAVNLLPTGVDASPVAVERQLLLRSKDRLYCLE